jgi:hypothetical protein
MRGRAGPVARLARTVADRNAAVASLLSDRAAQPGTAEAQAEIDAALGVAVDELRVTSQQMRRALGLPLLDAPG